MNTKTPAGGVILADEPIDEAPDFDAMFPDPPRFWERPCAGPGLVSYRFRGRYGWIMIGATDDRDALTEAARSATIPVSFDRLERWDGAAYVPVKIAT